MVNLGIENKFLAKNSFKTINKIMKANSKNDIKSALGGGGYDVSSYLDAITFVLKKEKN